MAVIEKTVQTIKMRGACPSHSRTDVSVRDLVGTTDEPEARGGTNKGPSPTETMMIALVGCTNVITNKLAHREGIELTDMTVDIQYDFHFRGARLEEDVTLPFDNITLTINAKATGTEAQFEPVKRDLPKYCPVSRALTAGGHGAKIEEVWNISHTG